MLTQNARSIQIYIPVMRPTFGVNRRLVSFLNCHHLALEENVVFNFSPLNHLRGLYSIEIALALFYAI